MPRRPRARVASGLLPGHEHRRPTAGGHAERVGRRRGEHDAMGPFVAGGDRHLNRHERRRRHTRRVHDPPPASTRSGARFCNRTASDRYDRRRERPAPLPLCRTPIRPPRQRFCFSWWPARSRSRARRHRHRRDASSFVGGAARARIRQVAAHARMQQCRHHCCCSIVAIVSSARPRLSLSRRLVLASRVEAANCVCNGPRIAEPCSPRLVVVFPSTLTDPSVMRRAEVVGWAARAGRVVGEGLCG